MSMRKFHKWPWFPRSIKTLIPHSHTTPMTSQSFLSHRKESPGLQMVAHGAVTSFKQTSSELKPCSIVTQKAHKSEASAGYQNAKEPASSLILLESIDGKRSRWIPLTHEQWAVIRNWEAIPLKPWWQENLWEKVCILAISTKILNFM